MACGCSACRILSAEPDQAFFPCWTSRREGSAGPDLQATVGRLVRRGQASARRSPSHIAAGQHRLDPWKGTRWPASEQNRSGWRLSESSRASRGRLCAERRYDEDSRRAHPRKRQHCVRQGLHEWPEPGCGHVEPHPDHGLELSLIHISEPTRLGMISYAVFCLKKKKKK